MLYPITSKQPTQLELFNTFLKEFTVAQLCEYCLLTHNTHTHLARFPGEEFFRYAQLCVSCIQDPKIKVK
ncbi:hypothetical protein ES705_27879 [subsurface metagenome]